MKNSILFLILLLCSTLAACSGDKPTQLGISQPGASPSPVTAASATPAEPPPVIAPVPARFRRTLAGLIDGKHAVEMELDRNQVEADQVWGSYRYKKIQKKSLSLQGKIAKDGSVELTETDENGKETGVFIGKLVMEVRGDDSRLKFTGDWKKSKSDSTALPFELAETRFDLGGMRMVLKEQSEENKKLKLTIDTAYPQLVGGDAAVTDTFNKALSGFATRKVAEFKKENKEGLDAMVKDAESSPGFALDVSYHTTFADKNLISVLVWTYQYTGGAHGGSYSTTFNYDLQSGRMLKLADLFQPNSGYLKVISNSCTAALLKEIGQEADQEWLRNGAAPKAENYKSWNVTPDGLQITFDAYQVAAYAFGPQEVVVPYSALKTIIKPNGALAAFAK
ncbi:MAG: DUF3298 and DUF4163 domain-containing protein [Acidobacteria bacterium]|nr:DUF3298 and DUF4163 domain-containing protein [Acidobacteriota bacterium]